MSKVESKLGAIANGDVYSEYFLQEENHGRDNHVFLVNGANLAEIATRINLLPENARTQLLLVDSGLDLPSANTPERPSDLGNRETTLTAIEFKELAMVLPVELSPSRQTLRRTLAAAAGMATLHSIFNGAQNLHVATQGDSLVTQYLSEYQNAINSLPGAEKFRIHEMQGLEAQVREDLQVDVAVGANYVLLSGGPDSATVLMQKHIESITLGGAPTKALFVNFGQPYLQRELPAAEKVAARTGLGVDLDVLDIPVLSEIFKGKGELGYPIFRELLPLTLVLATLHVRNQGGSELAHGQIREDEIDIPGTNRFFTQLGKALNNLLATEGGFSLQIPFGDTPKSTVFEIGIETNADLRDSVSCLKGGEGSHCGQCRACIRRKEAFKVAGVADNTSYQVP